MLGIKSTSKLDISVDKNNIIHLTPAGDFTKADVKKFKKWAENVHQTMLDVYKKTDKKVRFLTDASGLESMDEEVIEIYTDLLIRDLPYVYRSATFGASRTMLLWLATIMVESNRPNFQHFKMKGGAMEWLME